jgi:hypothetical protein
VTEAAPRQDVRGTFKVQDDCATGWCWCQHRPAEALRVEILCDGRVVASGLAARLELELVRPGVTDGYHGYLFILPKGLPKTAILEAREARTGKVFARQLPDTMPDVAAWQQRVARLGGAMRQLHDDLTQPGLGEARWSVALGASGALLGRRPAHGRAGLALRPVTDPLWTVILDLPRLGAALDEAAAQWEVTQLAPLLSAARAELVVMDDGGAAGFLTAVAGLRYAAVPRGAADVARLNTGLGLARGVHVAIFAPGARHEKPLGAPDRLRSRAALLAAPAVDEIVVGGGAAAAIRGAGLDALLPLVDEAKTETGLLLMAPRAVCETVGVLDAEMDDGADLALLDFALRAKNIGTTIRVLDTTMRLDRPGEEYEAATARRRFIETRL